MNQTTAPKVHVIENRAKVDVFGRLKPCIDALNTGVEVYSKPAMCLVQVSYKDLMAMPAFRSGVLEVLAKENEKQKTEQGA